MLTEFEHKSEMSQEVLSHFLDLVELQIETEGRVDILYGEMYPGGLPYAKRLRIEMDNSNLVMNVKIFDEDLGIATAKRQDGKLFFDDEDKSGAQVVLTKILQGISPDVLKVKTLEDFLNVPKIDNPNLGRALIADFEMPLDDLLTKLESVNT